MTKKIILTFGNGVLNGGIEVWEFIRIVVADTSLIESVSTHDDIWTVIIRDTRIEPEPEPEPEYRCNDDCWLYGREDEADGFFPCSHCYVVR